jgi:hypothetical protein
MATCSYRVSPFIRQATLAALPAFFLEGCSLFHPYPTPPDIAYQDKNSQWVVNDPGKKYEDAMAYAIETKTNYDNWLYGQAVSNGVLGTSAILLGGAALGLGTVGGSTAAVAALGTAGGAAVAIDQWVIGSPSKDPRMKAYAVGSTQLQCIIRDGRSAQPDFLADDYKTKLQQIARDKTNLDNAITDLQLALSAPPPQLPGDQLKAVRMDLAQQIVVQYRAADIIPRLFSLPGDIANAVDKTNGAAQTQALTGLPDITNLPKVTSLAAKPLAPAPAGAAKVNLTTAFDGGEKSLS